MIALTQAKAIISTGFNSHLVPTTEEKQPLRPGNLVKLRFETEELAERMWVKITSRNGSRCEGTLENEPFLLSNDLTRGDIIAFTLDHIIDIEN